MTVPESDTKSADADADIETPDWYGGLFGEGLSGRDPISQPRAPRGKGMGVDFRTGAGRWSAITIKIRIQESGIRERLVTRLPWSDITVDPGLFRRGVLLFPFSARGPGERGRLGG